MRAPWPLSLWHGANYGWGVGTCILRTPHEGVAAMLSPGSYGHGGAWGTQAWIDPVKGVAFVLMVQRSNFPNSDASDVRRAFQHRITRKLACEDDQRAIEQAALVEIAHELCDGPVDLLLHRDHTIVPVLVRIPILEGNVFARHLNKASPSLRESAREQAALAEPAGVVRVVSFLLLQL